MMEVKQNTPVDYNKDLLAANNVDSNHVEDELLTNNTNIKSLKDGVHLAGDGTNGKATTNGLAIDDIVDLDDELDADEPIPAEIEEALLADEELVAAKDVVKAENKFQLDAVGGKMNNKDTTRNPGDDLDTLLLKINNIVEECLVDGTQNSEQCGETNERVEKPEAATEVLENTKLLDESVAADDDENKKQLTVGEVIELDESFEEPAQSEAIKLNDSIGEQAAEEENEGTTALKVTTEEPTTEINESVKETTTVEKENKNDVEAIGQNDVEMVENYDVEKDKKAEAPVEEKREDTMDVQKEQENDEEKEMDKNEDSDMKEEEKIVMQKIEEKEEEKDEETELEEVAEKATTTIEQEKEVVKEVKVLDEIEKTQTMDEDCNKVVVEEGLPKNLENIEKIEIEKTENAEKTNASNEEQVENEETAKGSHKIEGAPEISTISLDDYEEDTNAIAPITENSTDVAKEANKDSAEENAEMCLDKSASTESTLKEKTSEEEDKVEAALENDEQKHNLKNEEHENAEVMAKATDADVVLLVDEDDVEELALADKQSKDIAEVEDKTDMSKASEVEESNNKVADTAALAETTEEKAPNDSAEIVKEDVATKKDRASVETDKDIKDLAAVAVEQTKLSNTTDTEIAQEDDSVSNHSSSSNLLEESKATDNIKIEASADNEQENEEEEDGDEVEIIEDDAPFDLLTPPAKRARLSDEATSGADERKEIPIGATEPESTSDKNSTSTTKTTTESTLKRTHELTCEKKEIKVEGDNSVDPDEREIKKPRTEYDETKPVIDLKKSSSTPVDELMENVNELKTEAVEAKTEAETDKKSIAAKEFKVVPSDIPIPLYPPPNMSATATPINLDFFKRFRKTFDQMTKKDLEELVLQKLVEAIVHKSEFASMRDTIEKQEKLIASHRTKISELSKQFRDLEMVHNRVVKSIQAKNSQFIMPVKITRAVGLQVYLASSRSDPMNIAPVGITAPPAPPAATSPSPGLTNLPPPSSPARSASQPSTSQASVQRLGPSSNASNMQRFGAGGNTALASAGAAAAANTRRTGCLQKVTPQRPVAPVNPNNSLQNAQKILNKSYSSSGSGAGNGNSNGSPVPTHLQRGRMSVPLTQQEQLRQHQQQQQQQNMIRHQQIQQQQQLQQQQLQQQQQQLLQQQQQQQQATMQRVLGSTTATTIRALAPGVTTQLPPRRSDSSNSGSITSSITAKAKDKSFIDLTDEDDLEASAQKQQNNSGAANMPQSTMATIRRVPPQLVRLSGTNAQASSKSQAMNSRGGQALKSPNNALGAGGNTSLIPGTSITRVQLSTTNPATTRFKNMHPARLPSTPPQAYNPTWKMAPPRPIIRINNMENGIVISWTMEEELTDRHAECINYQIYAYQETSAAPSVDSWHHVGTVKAMLLPMAVTLTQFQEGQRYYFAVRAVDVHQRFGPFSAPKTWG